MCICCPYPPRAGTLQYITTTEEGRECCFDCCIEYGLLDRGQGADGGHDSAEYFNGDQEYCVAVVLPKVLLDAMYELLHLWAFACLKGQVIVSVQGADVAQVLLDCGRPDGLESKV